MTCNILAEKAAGSQSGGVALARFTPTGDFIGAGENRKLQMFRPAFSFRWSLIYSSAEFDSGWESGESTAALRFRWTSGTVVLLSVVFEIYRQRGSWCGRCHSGLCSSLRTPSGGQGHFSQDTDVNGNVSPTTSNKSLGFRQLESPCGSGKFPDAASKQQYIKVVNVKQSECK